MPLLVTRGRCVPDRMHAYDQTAQAGFHRLHTKGQDQSEGELEYHGRTPQSQVGETFDGRHLGDSDWQSGRRGSPKGSPSTAGVGQRLAPMGAEITRAERALEADLSWCRR